MIIDERSITSCVIKDCGYKIDYGLIIGNQGHLQIIEVMKNLGQGHSKIKRRWPGHAEKE